jgi:two-component system, chemotaxis family, CheB/CheR fusion protein
LETTEEPDATLSNVFVRELENEVRRLREQLRVSIEQYESSSEELKASNEELQSINEEFRSATEELETSKEELQSVNEELQTVNNELKSKLEEVSRSHSDLQNLMSSTEIAMLFLDRELRIRHYTPGMQQLFHIMPGDRGRPINHLTHTLRYTKFFEDAEDVLRTLVTIEREVQDQSEGWFLLRMRPYRTLDDRIDGVIFTFVEITRLKQAEEQLIELNATLEDRVLERTRELDEANQKIRDVRDMFSALFNSNPIPTMLTRLDDDVLLSVNDEFLQYFHLEREKIIGQRLQDLGLGAEALVNAIQRLKQDGKVGSYEFEIQHPVNGARNILTSNQHIKLENAEAIISTFIDITDRVRAEQQIRSLASELTATEQAERHRLSQILHDDLQQRLFAIQMQLSFLKDAYDTNDLQAFAMDFPQIDEWLTDAIKVTRQLSVDLSPPILHGEGLVEAVIWLAAQMEEQYALKVNIKSNGKPAVLEERIRVLVFYALRELLFNVVKHAGTSQAEVRFEHLDTYLRLIVRDYGAGFLSEAVLNDPKQSHGLLTIRHRLMLLGCKMEIKSVPGKGTEVFIEVPFDQEDIRA